MSNTGLVIAGAGASVAGSSTDWTSPGNITADDGNPAYFNGAASDYLKASTFGISLPAGTTSIDGVVVQIQAKSNNIVYPNTISKVNVGTSDSTLGTEKSPATSVATTDTNYQYGTSTDVWGLTLAKADIEASTFQVRCKFTGSSGSQGFVDAIWVDVYYTASGGAGSGVRSFSPGIIG